MVEHFFEHPYTRRYLRGGVTGRHIDSFAAVLTERGFTRGWARALLRGVAHLGHWMEVRGIALGVQLHAEPVAQYKVDRGEVSAGNEACRLPGIVEDPCLGDEPLQRPIKPTSTFGEAGVKREELRVAAPALAQEDLCSICQRVEQRAGAKELLEGAAFEYIEERQVLVDVAR